MTHFGALSVDPGDAAASAGSKDLAAEGSLDTQAMRRELF